MAEVLLMVVSSLIGIVLWAFVGHGIWIVLRAVFGKLKHSRRACPECGRSILDASCSHCAAQRQKTRQSTASVDDDLQAAERLIKYARFKGWVDEAQHASNKELLGGLKSRVYGAAPLVFKADPREASPVMPDTAEPPTVEVKPWSVAAESSDRVDGASAVWDDEVVEADLVEADLVDSTTLPAQRKQAKDSSSGDTSAGEESRSTVGLRRPLGSRVTGGLLQRFMERSNIRWVELISAVLIVVCSIGLVISLWSTLSSTSRFFPSLVFLAATAAVHGAGQYTLRQWKLRSTSPGILHIGLMLIPLAVLVGILLSRRDDALPRIDTMTLATLAVGTLVYGGLAWTASRALFPRRWPVVAATTVIGCLTLVAVHLLAEYQQLETWLTWLLPWPIVLITQVAAISTSRTSGRRAPLRNRLTRQMVGVVVQTCFAAGVVVVFWGLAAHRDGGLFSAWWMMVAVLSAAWIGWSHSLGPSARSGPAVARRPRVASAFHSGLMIAGWSWGAVCAMLLLMEASSIPGLRTGCAAMISGNCHCWSAVGAHWG